MDTRSVPTPLDSPSLDASALAHVPDVDEAGAACQRPKTLPVSSLVPALTLIALNFVTKEFSLIDMVIDTVGSGRSHRPAAK